jgi:hypothetical protein
VLAQLPGDLHRQVDRHREGQPHVPAIAAVDHGIDAHHLTAAVEERAARAAGVDRDIGLYEGNVAGARQDAPDRADNTGCHAAMKAEGRADCGHPVAGLECRRVADDSHRQRGGIDFQEANVGALVDTHHACREAAPVVQSHLGLVDVGDHVGVREDQPVAVDDHARGEIADLAYPGAGRQRPGQPVGEVVFGGDFEFNALQAFVAPDAQRADVDH